MSKAAEDFKEALEAMSELLQAQAIEMARRDEREKARDRVIEQQSAAIAELRADQRGTRETVVRWGGALALLVILAGLGMTLWGRLQARAEAPTASDGAYADESDAVAPGPTFTYGSP